MPPSGPMWAFTLTIEMFLIERGVPLDVRKQWRSVLGRLAKRRFMQDHTWQNPNHIPAAHGSIVTVLAVRARRM
jgi:hypothetical protein